MEDSNLNNQDKRNYIDIKAGFDSELEKQQLNGERNLSLHEMTETITDFVVNKKIVEAEDEEYAVFIKQQQENQRKIYNELFEEGQKRTLDKDEKKLIEEYALANTDAHTYYMLNVFNTKTSNAYLNENPQIKETGYLNSVFKDIEDSKIAANYGKPESKKNQNDLVGILNYTKDNYKDIALTGLKVSSLALNPVGFMTSQVVSKSIKGFLQTKQGQKLTQKASDTFSKAFPDHPKTKMVLSGLAMVGAVVVLGACAQDVVAEASEVLANTGVENIQPESLGIAELTTEEELSRSDKIRFNNGLNDIMNDKVELRSELAKAGLESSEIDSVVNDYYSDKKELLEGKFGMTEVDSSIENKNIKEYINDALEAKAQNQIILPDYDSSIGFENQINEMNMSSEMKELYIEDLENFKSLNPDATVEQIENEKENIFNLAARSEYDIAEENNISLMSEKHQETIMKFGTDEDRAILMADLETEKLEVNEDTLIADNTDIEEKPEVEKEVLLSSNDFDKPVSEGLEAYIDNDLQKVEEAMTFEDAKVVAEAKFDQFVEEAKEYVSGMDKSFENAKTGLANTGQHFVDNFQSDSVENIDSNDQVLAGEVEPEVKVEESNSFERPESAPDNTPKGVYESNQTFTEEAPKTEESNSFTPEVAAVEAAAVFSSEPVSMVIEKGDRLEGIAREILEKNNANVSYSDIKELTLQIAEHNGIENANDIFAGQKIEIPNECYEIDSYKINSIDMIKDFDSVNYGSELTADKLSEQIREVYENEFPDQPDRIQEAMAHINQSLEDFKEGILDSRADLSFISEINDKYFGENPVSISDERESVYEIEKEPKVDFNADKIEATDFNNSEIDFNLEEELRQQEQEQQTQKRKSSGLRFK